MRLPLLLFLAALPGCATTSLPQLSPGLAVTDERRGAVELAVKGDFEALRADIAAGGGPALERAFDAAAVPPGDRPARRLQLSGDLALYDANPGALVTTLLLWGG